ncbi:hypothetical protein [Sphingomonas sp. MMS24-J13]|uniref:hypothetical protein n=1 Tax=Sphingomonas sp. MMS24-J13 TaxID=3238686 RepID=UPI00384F4E25
MIDRRALLASGLMLPGAALAAKLAPPDLEVNEAAVHWPIGEGRELHGYMAIPARARGRQPAVLVIGGLDAPDSFARALAKSVAQAGFVACTVNRATTTPARLTDDMRATAAWLANGRYGTGRVGAIGVAGGVDTVIALAATKTVTAAVTFGDTLTVVDTPILAYRRAGSGWVSPVDPGEPADWAEAWPRALAYLRERLV